jgi:hypothetical protein
LADFSSNKSVPANRKKGFYISRLPKNGEIGGIFVFRGSENFKLFSKITDQNLKNQKPTEVKANPIKLKGTVS